MMSKFKHQCPPWRPLGRVLSKHLGSRQHYPRIWMWVCRSFVIYLLLLQQNLRAIFLPHPPNPQLSFSLIFSICFQFFATVTCFPLQTQPCPRQIFKHFDLVISLTLFHLASIKLWTHRLELLLYSLFSFRRHINSKKRPISTDVNLHLAHFVLSSLFLLFFLLGEMIYLKQGQGHLPISKYH